MTYDTENILPPGARIKVIGVGGGGGNAVNTMIRSNLEGVEFVAANTDIQSLRFSLATTKLQLGRELTKGLGAGADPDIGRDAALEDRHALQEAISGSDMVFITAGMGGGTGTGGAAVVAQIARELGALTVAVVTKPFAFEGKRRRKHAELGIARLRENVDTLITIPNQRLLQIATPDLSMMDAFRMADNVLVNAVRGISDIINIPGTVNVDFADVKTVMSSMGLALMGIGIAAGPSRAVEAARQAICSPLLEDVNIEGATGILINITAGSNITLMEVNEACSIIQEAAHEDANIIFGAVIDEAMGDQIRVTVIATGFPAEGEDGDDILQGATPTFASMHRPLTSSTTTSFQRPKAQQTAHLPRTASPIVNARPAAPAQAPAVQPQQSPAPIAAQPIATPIPEQPITTTEGTENAFAGIPAATAAPQTASPEPSIDLPQFSAVTEAQGLTQWTFSSNDAAEQAPAQSDSEEIATTDIDSVFGAADDLSFAIEAISENRIEGASLATGADDEGFMTDLDLSVNDGGMIEDDIQTALPLESLFNQEAPQATSLDVNANLNQKIDEALELAERLKSVQAEQPDSDELDVPAFLRNGMKDLSLS